MSFLCNFFYLITSNLFRLHYDDQYVYDIYNVKLYTTYIYRYSSTLGVVHQHLLVQYMYPVHANTIAHGCVIVRIVLAVGVCG